MRAALEAGVARARRAARLQVVETPGEIPPGADLVYLGPGVRWDPPTAGVTIIAAEPDAVSESPDRRAVSHPDAAADTTSHPVPPTHLVAPVRLGPADPVPSVALAFTGALLSPDALAAVEAAGEAGRRDPSGGLDPAAGRVLHVLARARRSRSALELGTGSGAAAVWLGTALAAGGGRLESVERDAARYTVARRHVRQAGVGGVVELRMGDAARWLARLPGPFDLALLDEDPVDREGDLAALVPRLAPRALVVSRGTVGHAAPLTRAHSLLRSLPGVCDVATIVAGDVLLLALFD